MRDRAVINAELVLSRRQRERWRKLARDVAEDIANKTAYGNEPYSDLNARYRRRRGYYDQWIDRCRALQEELEQADLACEKRSRAAL